MPAGSIAAKAKSHASKPSKYKLIPAWYSGEKRWTKQDDFISVQFFGAVFVRFRGFDQIVKKHLERSREAGSEARAKRMVRGILD